MTDRATVYARIIELIEPLNTKKVALTEATSFAGDMEMDSLTVMDLVASMEDEWDTLTCVLLASTRRISALLPP